VAIDLQPVVLPADGVAALPETDLPGVPGVTHRVLWRDATSMAGVLRVPSGGHLGAHAHRENHHHLWVLEGTASVLGNLLGPGSYAHVPAGVEHDIEAAGSGPCTVYYLYIRQG
jgi:mannose-6-phosphate isomerase-like protein (cupin superfamily)